MKHKLLAVILILSIATVLLSLSSSCTGENDEEIATNVAKDWTSENIAYVSEAVAEATISNIQAISSVSASQIEDQINENITWTYSEPTKISDKLYEVIAQATTTISIPVIGSYSISAGFKLTIDTEQEEVSDYNIDIDSFEFSKE